MTSYDLLVIDPQNDFLDIAGAALPVPGANADMDRLAAWLTTHAQQVQSLTVTLDSHASVGVERTSFWLQADGSAVAPFTLITAADVQAGTLRVGDQTLTSSHPLTGLQAGQSCMLALRPEAVSMAAPEAGKNNLQVVVDDVSFLGSIVRIRTRTGDQVVSLDVFNDPNRQLPQRGTPVNLSFAHENLLVLQ